LEILFIAGIKKYNELLKINKAIMNGLANTLLESLKRVTKRRQFQMTLQFDSRQDSNPSIVRAAQL